MVDTFNEFHWHVLDLPGRHFRWRIRGNPLSWLHQLPESEPDIILATSMVDVATLKGLHPRLANVHFVYYFHENQFAYPVSKAQLDSVEPKMVQLYGALAADKLLFNSNYNLESFLSGIETLLNKLPDETPPGVVEAIKNKSSILPVVVNPIESAATKNKKLILWNHRWEYDKAPQVFTDALLKLNKTHADFEIALLGRRPVVKPEALIKIESLLGDKIVVNGKVSKEEYEYYLARASIVVSTAMHEFQGLSMLEAVSAGAIPLVPDDLCYREQYKADYRYKPGDSDALAEKLLACLTTLPDVPDVSSWYGEKIIEDWRQLLKYS